MYLVDSSDDDLVHAPLGDAVVRTVTVPGSVGATHVWLFLIFLINVGDCRSKEAK